MKNLSRREMLALGASAVFTAAAASSTTAASEKEKPFVDAPHASRGSSVWFGITVAANVGWATLLERWRLIERLAFDTLWVSDHFRGPWFEAWTLLSGLATQTRSIRIGTLVTAATFRNPAFLAKQALTVDHLSGGRLELGLGSGYAPGDFDHTMTGIPVWDARERTARFEEVVQIVDRLLRKEVVTFKGRYYEVKEAAIPPGPLQHPRPPFTIAAEKPRMLRTAAKYGECCIFGDKEGLQGRAAIDATRKKSELLDRHCAELGRDGKTIRRAILRWGRPGPDDFWASPAAFEDYVERYIEIDITGFNFTYPRVTGEVPGIFEQVATEVIPQVKARHGTKLDKPSTA